MQSYEGLRRISEDTGEGDEEDLDEVPAKSAKIPKYRLDQVLNQRNELRERNAWLEKQLEKLIEKPATSTDSKKEEVPSFDFDSAEEEYATLLIEGEISKASKLRNKIESERQKEIQRLIADIKQDSIKEAKEESNSAIEAERFSNLVSKYEAKYPFLDADSDSYNEEAIETVNALMAGYVASGKSKTEALKLAINKVTPMYEQEESPKKRETLGKKRAVESIKKAAKASNSQPPKTRSVSTSSIDKDVIDITKMSDRDFNKLTEKEKRLLRGD